MGRLPTTFADQNIRFRIPHLMPGELLVPNGSAAGTPFPEAVWLQNIELPFEIHRFGSVLTPFDNATPQAPIVPDQMILFPSLPDILAKFVKLRIEDSGKNQKITRNDTRISSMLPKLMPFWEWEEPYTITKQEQFSVAVTNELPDFVLPNNGPTVHGVRVECLFEGFLLVCAPPGETR
jgi:hypothetical protein